jgi:hypothetical protein
MRYVVSLVGAFSTIESVSGGDGVSEVCFCLQLIANAKISNVASKMFDSFIWLFLCFIVESRHGTAVLLLFLLAFSLFFF